MIQNSCSTRNFKSLMVTQFFGALNDNVFKTAVGLLIISLFAEDEATRSKYLSLTTVAYVTPFILFSSYSGWCADRFGKVGVMRIAKLMEVIIAVLGGYFLYHLQVWPLICVLFLMGMHSALFSPCKYGILPEILHSRDLSRGNGYVELWTLVGILLGRALAAPLKVSSNSLFAHPGIVPGVMIVTVSLIGLAAVLRMSSVPAANPAARFRVNPLMDVLRSVGEIAENKPLFLAFLGIVYFAFAGEFVGLTVYVQAERALPGRDLYVGAVLTALTLGIGAGSVFAGRVSAGKVELGLVPIGVFGIAVTSACLAVVGDHPAVACLLLTLLGISGGIFIVPLNAFFQERSPRDRLGRYLAANNFFSFGGSLLAAGVFWLISSLLGLPPSVMFLLITVTALLVGLRSIQVLPEMLVRCVNWILANFWYRLQVVGVEHVPEKGGALLVCNHVSHADPALILAALGRPVRFMMYRQYYENRWLNPIAKTMRVIPIATTDGPRALVASFAEARRALEAGELVCIFAEGSITRIGQLLPFRAGFERIVRGLDVPIIPTYLDQMWGSIFSYHNGKFFWKIPQEIPYPVSLNFGVPLSSAATVHDVRRAVQELGAAAASNRTISRSFLHSSLKFLARCCGIKGSNLSNFNLLHSGFLRMARRRWFAQCIVDTTGKSKSWFGTLCSALTLSSQLKGHWGTKRPEMVGVLLPPSVGGVVTNLALMMSGAVPVNLNYTAAKDSLRSAMEQCGISLVISSKAFLEKQPIEVDAELLTLEQLADETGLWSRLRSALIALFLPRFLIERWFIDGRKSENSLATVIFSSGSTGEPKGVMLSHRNINSNIKSLYDVFRLEKSDGVVGILPFFHSFGFTGGLWLPLLSGIRGGYHSNPVDAQAVGELVERYRLTILMATPTFLLSYLRRCTKEQFSTLRYVITGAEKLKRNLAESFEERFGIEPLEGYGCSELSPVAILNIPDFEGAAGKQIGHKPGSVGHPIPGVSARIVDPETFELRQPGEDGLLLVTGPNVMLGYLGNPEKTAEVIRDGWYVTGDIATMDPDGFITITDRLSRFSKIGGEMVPHVKLEEEIHKVLEQVDQVCVVTAVPDERKGERLVVLCTIEIDAALVTKGLSERGLPNLWIPKREHFYRIKSIPQLGSGKLDLRTVKRLAQELSQGSASSA